jgi:serine/threonine-protein kinase
MRALPHRNAVVREGQDAPRLKSMDLIAPEALVGSYKVVELIARGAMGHVYRATDVRSGRDVALKVPSSEGAREPGTLRRFLREVRVAARLVHPHIAAFYGGFEHAGRPWIAMELIDGPSFGEWIDTNGPMPLADVLRHGEGIASALEFAHARGILHHDVSPQNIVIAPDGRAKLLDFGLAGFLAAPSGSQRLQPARATVAGTVGYMSPEKILGRPLDARSDLFSLGAVLYELATGRPAFPRSTREEILDATLEAEPAAMGLPAAFEAIVRKALAKSPDDRYASAAELAAALRAYLEGIAQ